MSNESKQSGQNATPEAVAQPKPKSGLLKYIIFGVAGLVVIAGIAFGTLMLIGGDKKAADPEKEEPKTVAKAETKAEKPSKPQAKIDASDTLPAEDSLADLNNDSLLAEIMKEADADSSILDDVQNQLAFLDVADTQGVGANATAHLSKADSTKEANWITEQKAQLAKKETDLNDRARKLDAQEKKLQQQIARIEQAESARVTNLAKLYDGMEAKQVVALMANLDDETVVSVLPRMKPKNASAVLGMMPAPRAAKLSKEMITIAGTE